MKIIVYDANGKDVTNDRDWYVGVDGTLYFEIEDIDCPLMEADGYTYSIVITNTMQGDILC